MNKMKKLLSVLLAVVIALSCMSMTASAAVAKYKTVDNLTDLKAYSPYGQVTRLSTEDRLSIVFDFLDGVLENANIQIAPVDLSILGTLVIDLGSLNGVLKTVDNVKELVGEGFSGFVVTIASSALGIIGDLEFKTWQAGMTREKTANKTILRELFELLQNNKKAIADIVRNRSINLGSIIGGFVDISSVNKVIADIPGLIKGLIFPKFERWDDTLTEIKAYDTASTGDGQVIATLNTFVKNLFNNDMSITTLKYDANGNMTSEHTNWLATATGSEAPGTPSANSPRCYYQFTSTTPGSVMTVWHIVDAKEAEALAKTPDEINGSPAAYTYFEEKQTFVMSQEVEPNEKDPDGSDTYVWKATDENKNTWSLKWYNDESQFLPGFSGKDFDITTMSAAQLLYTFIPPVFSNMAPVVLNGSVKKILAEFFGAQFTYVGDVVKNADGTYGLDAAAKEAIPDADESNALFTQKQGEYLWEWSNYAVINGNHYWRFEDQIWAGDLSKKNNYFDIIDWDYEITGDFMNEFVPADGKGSESNTLLMNLNNFLIKVAETITKESVMTEDSYVNPKTGEKFTAQWTRPTLTKGGNENLVANIKAAAQAVIKLAPQHIFGSDYETNPRCYFNLLTSNDNQTVLTGIAATLVDALMPQMILPTKNDLGNTEVGAILAAVVRELATQLVPQNNYDALIYADYGTSTTDKVKTFLTGKGNAYWLDVCLVMGVDIGIKYLHNLADMGGDTAALKAIGWGIDKTWKAEEATIEATRGYWEALLNYIVDWGLGSELYQWKMSNLVTVDGNTVWEKLDDVFFGILPLDQILNVTLTDSTSKTEQVLRYDLILALLNLEWHKVTNLVRIPDASELRTTNALQGITNIVKTIVNGLFAKVGGGSYALLPAGMTDLDSLANQTKLGDLIEGLLNALPTAVDKGLLDTVAPFLNMFIGWKTSPQEYAEPLINLSYEDDADYLYTGSDGNTTATGTIHLKNNASGMLLTHRTSTKNDNPYILKITSVTSEDATVKVKSGLNTEIHPGNKGDVVFDIDYTADKAIMLKVVYEFKGKSGAAIGGPQTMYVQTYISNKQDDGNIWVDYFDKTAATSWGGLNAIEVRREGYNPYHFITNLADIETIGYTFNNIGSRKNAFVSVGRYTSDTAPAPFSMFPTSKWVHGSSEQESKLPHGAIKYSKSEDTNKSQFYTLYPYIYDETSEVKPVTGTKLALPTLSYIGWKNSSNKSVDFSQEEGRTELTMEIYYYDLTELNKVYDGVATIAKNDFNVSDTVWNTFKAARDAAVALIFAPKKLDTFTSVYSESNILAKADALKTAYEAVLEADKTAGSSSVEAASTDSIKANLEKDDDKYGLEINFQDYVLYEYFVYQDVRTLARNILAQYEEPKLIDKYYIEGSGISLEELNKVIAAENNAAIAAGIEASKTQRKPEEIEASQAIIDAYVAPTYTDLYLDDIADKLDWYRGFIEQTTAVKTFLEKEIAYADANYNVTNAAVEALYTVDSWKAYKDAYDYAKEVNSGTTGVNTLQSTVFEAKWGLMVAMKNLLLKENSLIEKGGTAVLEGNIITANAIFASLAAGDGAWTLKEGVDADTAYAELISALGYYYVGEDGITYNLYADSALEYRDNDRPNRQANKDKVNKSNAALVAAIANFEAKATEIEVAVKEDYAQAEFVIYDTANTNNDEYTGIIYGIDVLDQNPDFAPFTENGLMDALTTTSGDDYMVITPNAQGIESTGALVEVFDANGEVKATYVFVYFGDIDGDGMITAGDAAIAEYYEVFYEGFNTYAEYVASDLDTDGMTTAGDAAIMEYYEVFYEGVDYQYNLGQVAVNNTYEWM